MEDTSRRITDQLSGVLAQKTRPVCVGGDHSILLPILRAIHKRHGPVALVQFDAHNDTWSGYFGSPHSHGTPVRRAVEEGLLLEGGVLQAGLRGPGYSPGELRVRPRRCFDGSTSWERRRAAARTVSPW